MINLVFIIFSFGSFRGSIEVKQLELCEDKNQTKPET